MENVLQIGDKIKWHNPLLGKREGTVTNINENGIFVTSKQNVKYHIRPDNEESNYTTRAKIVKIN